MFGLGTPELIVILSIVLLVLAVKSYPNLAPALAKA